MASFIDKIFNKKAVPVVIGNWQETTRDGIHKSYIPKFLYRPPYGYPRFSNLDYVRYLAQTPYVEMCVSTILDEISAIEWDIVPNPDVDEEEFKDEDGNLREEVKREINHIKNFFQNPNTNYESFEETFIRYPVRDLLEINTGVLVKSFNLKEEMVEVIARDGATFTKNPDIHGMFTDREELILQTEVVDDSNAVVNRFRQIGGPMAREKAAYFQYGWIAGPMPIPFGKREIVWLQKMIRTDDHYGYSPVQILAKNLQMLLYHVESDLEYFNNNNVPKGIIGLDGSNSEEIEQFKEQWQEVRRTKDDFGNWKTNMHKVPILNFTPKFERIEFNAAEMQLIEKQKWYTNMVWACFGVTATELGYTQDAKGSANQIVQSKVFRKKAINPILRMLETKYDTTIIPEFEYTIENNGVEMQKYVFKFMTKDTDEERQKAELYKLQVESGQRTINEVREEEGKEPVAWGDKPPRDWQQADTYNDFGGFGDFFDREKDAQDTRNNMKEPEVEQDEKSLSAKEKRRIEKESEDEEDEDKTEKKAVTTDNPLILKENERPTGYSHMQRAIITVLRNNEEDIKKILETEMGKNKISEIKSLNDVIKKIKSLFNFQGLKNISDAIIKNNFMEGHDEAEKQLDKNFLPDTNAIDYIQNYTFENIKGMTDDLANNLRGELQRAYMDGESIEKIKARVQKVFNTSENRAEKIARTETNRARNTGKLLAFKNSGVKGKKRYVAKIDDRTSPICKRMNGQIVDLDDDFEDPKGEWSGQNPPAHVNCRSTWVFVPDEE